MKWCVRLLALVAMATLIDTSNAGVISRAKREVSLGELQSLLERLDSVVGDQEERGMEEEDDVDEDLDEDDMEEREMGEEEIGLDDNDYLDENDGHVYLDEEEMEEQMRADYLDEDDEEDFDEDDTEGEMDDAELALRELQDEFKKRREEIPVRESVMSSLDERLSRLIEQLEGLKQMKREQEEDVDETRAMEKEEEIELEEQEEEMRAMEEMEDIEAAEQEEEIRAMEEEEEKEAAEQEEEMRAMEEKEDIEAAEQEEAMRAMEEEEEKEAAEQEEEARAMEEEEDIEAAEQEKEVRAMFGGGNNLEKQLFNLKFAAKNLQRSAQKSDKMEKMEKTKLKLAIQKHNMEGARIHAENSIRQHKQSLHFLRLSSRVDAVAQRVQTAVTMKKVTGYMSGVVKSMDSALKSMDLEKVAAMMDKFERQFGDLDVQSAQMEGAMSGTTTLNVPKAQVDKLMQQVADEHGLKLNI